MTSGTLCKYSFNPGCFAMGLRELAPALEAGYRASLDEDDDRDFETAHFTVIKTRDELDSASAFLQPFFTHWRVMHSEFSPTVIVISLRRRAQHERILQKRCGDIIRAMGHAAHGSHLVPYGVVYGASDRLVDSAFFENLGIPGTFTPIGVIGLSSPGLGRRCYAS